MFALLFTNNFNLVAAAMRFLDTSDKCIETERWNFDVDSLQSLDDTVAEHLIIS